MKPFGDEDGLFLAITMPLSLLLMSLCIALLGMEVLVTKVDIWLQSEIQT